MTTQAREYPLDVKSTGSDTYIMMSKGHHNPHEFMKAVRDSDCTWPLGMPEQVWIKATPCNTGEFTSHYSVVKEEDKVRGAFPATYCHEEYGEDQYQLPYVELLSNLPSVIDDMEYGFHFEEGGCYAFASALHATLEKHGVESSIAVNSDESHAFLRIGEEYFDHLGEPFVPRKPFNYHSQESLEEIACKHHERETYLLDISEAHSVIDELFTRIK